MAGIPGHRPPPAIPPSPAGSTNLHAPPAFAAHVRDLLAGKPDRCRAELRMTKGQFIGLRDELVKKRLLSDRPGLQAGDQLAIFLFIMGRDRGIELLQDKFEIGREVIDRFFLYVVQALCKVAKEYLKLWEHPDHKDEPVFKYDRRFYPYFKNCIGAIGGTHVPATLNPRDGVKRFFRNRKGILSQNVMAAVNFDHTFSYILTAWEGCGCDALLLKKALEELRLSVPEGKYYVVDSEYANSKKFVAPYHGERNHISEFGEWEEYSSPRDRFNHHHAQLMKVVGQTFDLLKSRFPILNFALPYPFGTQGELVIAACVVHNYIFGRRDQISLLFEGIDSEMENESSNDEEELEEIGDGDLRSFITDKLWDD